jgi:purine catabolism regulator
MVAGSALEPLTEHDRLRGTHLLTTLEVFLAHNSQAVPAAAALGVHRHTLRNRIRKVTELTGRNLDSPHDRTELWLALKAREIAQLGPQPRGRGDQPAERGDQPVDRGDQPADR